MIIEERQKPVRLGQDLDPPVMLVLLVRGSAWVHGTGLAELHMVVDDLFFFFFLALLPVFRRATVVCFRFIVVS